MTSIDQQALKRPANEAVRRGRNGTGWYAWLARAGLVAKGVSYGIVGVLAVKLAAGHGGAATSRQGALHALAQERFGQIVLILLALGFAAYAIWRAVQALATPADEAKDWGKRAGYLGRAAVYVGLTFSALSILLGDSGGTSQTGKAHKTTAVVLSWPAGTWLVGLGGAILIGVGLWNTYRGLARKFEGKWNTGGMGARARRWGARVGVVGHLARAVVFTLIGVFVIRAALQYDPKEAVGLDGALQKLASADYGPYLLGLTAAGLIAYGLFCLTDARFRDVSAS
jgi:Domain of Unknown Function (DUF1206)